MLIDSNNLKRAVINEQFLNKFIEFLRIYYLKGEIEVLLNTKIYRNNIWLKLKDIILIAVKKQRIIFDNLFERTIREKNILDLEIFRIMGWLDYSS